MQIQLVYPWMFRDSPYYKYLKINPPRNTKYLDKRNNGVSFFGKDFRFILALKKTINIMRKFLPIPNIKYVNSEVDMLFCARCINIGKTPYVVDIEDYWSLGGVDSYVPFGRMFLTKELEKNKCRAILPWTKWAKERFLNVFKSKKIAEKTHVLYPAVPLRKPKKKKDAIIFISRYFWLKGGLIALETMSQIKKKWDVDCYVISEVPENLKKRYPNLDYLGVLPHEKVLEYLDKSKVFLYPSFVDTFGFALLESLSCGTPIISVDTIHDSPRRELLNEKYSIVHSHKITDYKTLNHESRKLVEKLFESIVEIFEDNSKFDLMKKEARLEISKGRFSIKNRNKILEKTYFNETNV